jgi:hypothetical protein
MIRVKSNNSYLLAPIYFNKLLTPKKTHCITFLCWISLIVVGTFLIGLSTNLYNK